MLNSRLDVVSTTSLVPAAVVFICHAAAAAGAAAATAEVAVRVWTTVAASETCIKAAISKDVQA